MRQRHKSKPEDNQLAYDERARPVDRAGAVKRLAIDGFMEIEPLLTNLLHHDEFILRGQAIKSLLGMWTKPRYIDDAVRMLHSDPEWEVRSSAAFALSSFAKYTGEQHERIIRELAQALLDDKEWAAQKACYLGLLELLAPDKIGKIDEVLRKRQQRISNLPAGSPPFDPASDYFNRDRDVDWELLKPYLDAAPRIS